MVEVVEADGDAVPEDEGAPVLLFVGAEALLEVLGPQGISGYSGNLPEAARSV